MLTVSGFFSVSNIGRIGKYLDCDKCFLLYLKLKLSFMGTNHSLPGPLDFGMHYRLTLRILNHSIFLRVKLEDSYSVSARFRHNVVIIKPYCRLKIELSSFEIHNISLRNTGFFVCVWRSFLWLICCFSGDVFLI